MITLHQWLNGLTLTSVYVADKVDAPEGDENGLTLGGACRSISCRVNVSLSRPEAVTSELDETT